MTTAGTIVRGYEFAQFFDGVESLTLVARKVVENISQSKHTESLIPIACLGVLNCFF